MTTYIMRLIRLFVGLFVFTFGLVTTINADLGMSSWNCLNSGIIKHIDITFGQANIAVAVLLVLLTFFAKERIGLGTLGNMVLVGSFMDIIQGNNLIPSANNLFMGIFMVFLGMFISSLGVYLYLGAGFGAGPRDGVMLALMKFTGKPLAKCRITIEVVVLTIAILLGGYFGIGTIITTFCNGPIMQTTFKMLKFNPKALHHEYIDDIFRTRRDR